MKNFAITLMFLFLSVFNYAQGFRGGGKSRGSGGVFSTLIELESVVQSKGILTQNNEAIDGTMYLFPKWEAANHIYVTEEKGYKVQTLNYNLVSKTLEAKISKDSVYQFSSDKIAFAQRDNRNYRYFNINNSNELYLVIFASKKGTLIKGFELELIKANISPMTQETLSKAKYVIKDKFFYKLNNSEFTLIEPKKKSILKIFKDKAEQIEKYAADNKLGYTTENDLYKIFRFYDSL